MARAKRSKLDKAANRGMRGTRRIARRGRRRMRTATTAAPFGRVQDAVKSLRAYADELLRQRATLDVQIQKVQEALRAIGGGKPGRPAGRVGRPPGAGGGPRAGSLKEHIVKILSGGGTMRVKDITEAVRASGYQTRNKTLAKSVGIALAQMPQVKKVGRGRFRLK